MKSIKNGEALAAVEDTSSEASATPMPTATAQPTDSVDNPSESGNTWIWFVIGGVVVVAVAAVVVVTVVKKKKSGENADEPKE